MCGILFAKSNRITKNEFISSLNIIKHRGPDAPLCFFQHNDFMLGHNRLSIMDLDLRANQPFFSDDQRYVMIYNGEVYNYRELASQYMIEMKTSSDTELILKLYLKIGSSMLNKLNGMFSLIILDTLTNEYFIARDRLGIKPLYYVQQNSELIISSEVAPLLNFTSANLDETAIRQYKKMRNFFNNRTMYKNIREFPPAHFSCNGKVSRYWSNNYSEKAPPTDEELKYLIESAVNYRKISDVSVGSYLSGGLDSTIVTALANVNHTWTIGFENENEFKWSKLAADKFGTEHHCISINREEFLETARKLITERKELLTVPNEVLIYFMTLQAKSENTVILSGEGADELFFGYDRIFKWADATTHWDIEGFNDLYSYGSHDDLEIIEDAINPYLIYQKPISIVASFFQEAHLRGLLRRLDNSTMMCSVEARSPFLDFRLVERLSGVSIAYKMENQVVKAPLKRVFRDLLPIEVVERKKIGFPVPLTDIFTGQKAHSVSYDSWFDFNLAVLEGNL